MTRSGVRKILDDGSMNPAAGNETEGNRRELSNGWIRMPPAFAVPV